MGLVEVPALEAEKEMGFDWDQELRVSARAREALEFMRVALEAERFDAIGQPLRPVVPSSLYGAFLAREETDARVLVITFDAIVHGWGAVLRSSQEKEWR